MNNDKRHEFGGIDVFFSAECNMKCKYCFIPKTPKLKEMNKKIRQEIISGKLVENIVYAFKDTIDKVVSLNLWGAEPTINKDYYKKFVYDLLPNFPYIDNIFFSTNGLMGANPILEFINVTNQYCLDNPDRKITMRIQLSLDGDAWITDVGRHEGATTSILNTINVLYHTYIEHDYVVPLIIQIKPTISVDSMKAMMEHGIEEWFIFFENLYNQYDLDNTEVKNLNIKKNINLHLLPSPTIVIPAFDTQEDGLVFAKWLQAIMEMDYTKLQHYHTFPYKQPETAVFKKIFATDRIIIKSFGSTCGGGAGTIAFGTDGTMVLCHRGFRSIYDNQTDPYSFLQHIESCNIHNNLNATKFNYLVALYHDNNYSRMAHFDVIIRQLAYSGQINKEYLYDDKLRMLLIYFVDSTYCYVGNTELTKSLFVPTTSLFKFFGNGAVQKLMTAYGFTGVNDEL